MLARLLKNTKRPAPVVMDQPGLAQPLLVAVEFGDTGRVLNLLAQGAPANTTNANGMSVLHIAAMHGHKSTLDALIGAGADINARTPDGNTALHLAVRRGIAARLLQAGIDVSARNAAGSTALDVAHTNSRNDVTAAILNAISLRGTVRIDEVVTWWGRRSN